MLPDSDDRVPVFSEVTLDQLEDQIARFEDAWSEEEPLAIAACLPTEPAQRRYVLVELIHIDLEFRLKAGQPARVEDYLHTFPELAQEHDTLLELIQREFELRRRQDPSCEAAEYLSRFPDFQAELATRLTNQPRPSESRRVETPPDGEGTVSYAAPVKKPGRSRSDALPVVPGYEMQRVLGRGGMGIVYQARHVTLKRPVALKMILAGHLAGKQERDRFRLEAEAVARLRHPNIVQVYEIGEHDGRPYFSLEFVEGGALDRKLARTPQPPVEAARLVEVLARAMHHAHEQNILHRDLKPANVLLTADGQPKITDFGLAKQLDDVGQTHTGAVLGTPCYMAPEQAQGQKNVGPAADVYALGAILYELLTGRPPFRGPTALDTLEQVRSQEPVPPSRLVPAVPRDLETICLKCLQKGPERRYPSAAQLADDLGRFRAGEPIRARAVPRTERAWKAIKRRPAVAAALAGTGLAMLFLVAWVVGLVYNQQVQHERDEAQRQRARAEGQQQVAEQHRQLAEQEGRRADEQRLLAQRLQYAADMSLAQRAWRENQIARAAALLERYRPEGGAEPDLRGFEWYHLRCLCQPPLLDLPSAHFPFPGGVALSADGKRFAVATKGQVKLLDTANWREVDLLKANRPGGYSGLAFSPDGKRLAASGAVDKPFQMWDLETGKEFRPSTGNFQGPSVVRFSPDGKRLATANQLFQERVIRLYDVATGEEVAQLKGHFNSVTSLAYSPDGKWLASVAGKEIKVHDTLTGEVLRTLSGPAAAVWDIAISPDGKWVASCDSNQQVIVWDATTGKHAYTVALGPGAPAMTGVVAFSRDSKRVAAGSGDSSSYGEVKVWDVTTRSELLHLRGHTRAVNYLAFDPEAKWLLTAASGEGKIEVKVWDITVESAVVTLKGHTNTIWSVAFSPDGRWLASADRDRKLTLWDLSGQELPRTEHLGNDDIWTAAFSPDGKQLIYGSGQNLTLFTCDARTLKRLGVFKGGQAPLTNVIYRPDGKQLRVRPVPGTKDGQAGDLTLFDAFSGQEVRTLRGPVSYSGCLACSPDEKWLAVASSDRSVKLFDLATGEVTRTLEGHTGSIKGLAFSPDGRRLLSGSADKTVRLWDTDTGQELFSVIGDGISLECVAFSPDGQQIAAVGWERMVRIWNAPRSMPKPRVAP